jgi:hypothetical protein
VRLSAVPIVRHAIPGRVRLRLEPPDADRGEEVARALAAQEGVRRVVWNGLTRSLTIYYDPSGPERVGLPASSGQEARDEGPLLSRMDLGRLLFSCLLALVPVGPLGSVAIALATSLLEESRKRPVTAAGGALEQNLTKSE